jgi:hypothetical protein
VFFFGARSGFLVRWGGENKYVWLKKKNMNLCTCESEEHEHGVGPGVNITLLSDSCQIHYTQ